MVEIQKLVKMGTSSKELAKKLWKLAQRQHGCFTAAQAVELGYADSVHLYHVKKGDWIRVFRGVYRLADHVETPSSRCMAALLWTRDKNGTIQGVLSAETANELFNKTISDIKPIKLVVPKRFRRSSAVPKGIQLSKMYGEVHKSLNIGGFPVESSSDPEKNMFFNPKLAMDMPDLYDWMDYQAVLCSEKS